jgi:hypothetical protein
VLGLDARAHLVGMRLGIGAQRIEDLHLDVAAQLDVGAAPGHVGGDGDGAGLAGFRHDLRLARVLAGVEHVVRDAVLLEQVGQHLDFSMLVVPTRIGWPRSWLSRIALTMASYFSRAVR